MDKEIKKLAKEKAIDLFTKIWKGENQCILKEEAKACSLICVDEIITELSKAHLITDLTPNLEFWQEVKNKINEM